MKDKKPRSSNAPKVQILDTHSLDPNIYKLLTLLNAPETQCTFWIANEPDVHIMGIRPIKRTTVEIINESGFTPYENKVVENLFKVFKIYVLDNKESLVINNEELEKKREIEKNGVIYIKHYELVYIFETIRKSM